MSTTGIRAPAGPPGAAAALAGDGAGARLRELARRLWRSPWRGVLAAGLGAAGGAAYAHFVGCRVGTCPLTSDVWTAGLSFGPAGGVAGWPEARRRKGPRAEPGAARRS